MKKLIIFAAVVSLMACGTEEDPSKNNENNTNTNNNNTTGDNNGTTGGGDNNASNNDNNETTGGSTGNTIVATECELNTVFFGQIGSDREHGGGVPLATPFPTDAGLSAVLAMIPAVEGMDDFDTDDIIEGSVTLAAPLAVSGAIVTSTNFGMFGDSTFWIQDSTGGMKVGVPVSAQTLPLSVGDVVSFNAVDVYNENGTPRISGISDFVIDSNGGEVPYAEKTGADFTAADVYTNVRIFGTLGAVNECGSRDCFTLNHGGKEMTFRVGNDNDFLETGDCITYVGPLGAFPGPLDAEGGPAQYQINVDNFDWYFETFLN